MRLQGKVAVATAAAQGIGRATAEAFAREGAHGLCSRHQRGEARRAEGRPHPRRAPQRPRRRRHRRHRQGGRNDRHPVQLRRLRARRHHPRCDRGRDLPSPWTSTCGRCSVIIRAFLPGMLAQRRGSIINMASVVELGERRAEPLHLRRQQGRRHRPHQIGGGRLRRARHSLQCHMPRHRAEPLPGGPAAGAR